jgi:hypothetical protein
MTILVFEDKGTVVATAAWTVCPNGSRTSICYVWGADGISWISSATGTARFEMDMPLEKIYRIDKREVSC